MLPILTKRTKDILKVLKTTRQGRAKKLIPLEPPRSDGKPRLCLNLNAVLRSPELLNDHLPIIEEITRRTGHPVHRYVPDDSEDRNQLACHKSTATYLLVFGGNQSGKSLFAAMEIIYYLRGNHPYKRVPKKARVWVLSAQYKTIQNGVYRHLKDLIPYWEIKKRGQIIPQTEIPSYIEMTNGARVEFVSGFGRETAREKIQAAAIDLAAVDEEVDGALWDELRPRLLSRNGRAMITATLVKSDPWLLDLEDDYESGRKGIDLFRLSTKRAAEAGHISMDAYDRLHASYSSDDRLVRLMGQSRRHEGLIYRTFDRRHIVEPFTPPREWPRYVGIDPGQRTFAIIFAAVDHTGKVYLYDEIYLAAKNYREVAHAFFQASNWDLAPPEKQVDGQNPWSFNEETSVRYEDVVIDPSAFGKEVSGEPKVGHLLYEYGLETAPAFNDVDTGIEKVRCALEPQIDGKPKLFVMRHLVNAIWEFRHYRWRHDAKNTHTNEPLARPIKRKDHLMDCVRYIFHVGMEAKARPRQKKVEREMVFDTSRPIGEILKEEWREIMKEQANASTPRNQFGLGNNY